MLPVLKQFNLEKNLINKENPSYLRVHRQGEPNREALSRAALAQSFWTPQRLEELKRLVNERLTGGQIAAHFGVTRNAILGKLHRLGLKIRSEAAEITRVRRLTRAVTAKDNRRPPKPKSKAPRINPDVFIPRDATVEPPLNIGLLDLRVDHCREPVGTGEDGLSLSCGHPIAKGSYCAGHARINYMVRR